MTAFEDIYRTYFHDVYLYIRRLSGDELLSEEIVSEVFFKAMQAVDTFRGDCDIRVWLCQIAKNCYYTHLKKQGRVEYIADLPLAEMPSEEKTVEETFIRRDEAARIRRALHQVPEPYKEVFMWRVFAELSFRQIGQIFGKTENWACVTYHRAKAMIQNRMEDAAHGK